MECELYILDTGFCWAWENHIRSGAARKRVRCHALVALIRHPKEGWILFDTGYAPRFSDAVRHLPYSFYRWATPIEISNELAVVSQLAVFGIASSDVQHVIVSRFHADHVAGLMDFPESRIVCHHEAYTHFRQRKGLAAVRKAYLPQLVPPELMENSYQDFLFDAAPLPGLGNTHDLFGDGSIRLVSLPGHARGQIGALVAVDESTVFLAADGCWQCESLKSGQPPHWITHLFIDSVSQMRATMRRIAEFHSRCPETIMIPCHCPDVFARCVNSSRDALLDATMTNKVG